uniref:tRNA (guanine(46)-N(7))-methyltransferase n=1 Tax=Salmo trutta TaxID=8032 RepID=A0A674BEU2_SALTR
SGFCLPYEFCYTHRHHSNRIRNFRWFFPLCISHLFPGVINNLTPLYLSVELSLLFPNQLILGLEICVRLGPRPYPLPACCSYRNISCLRSNTMRYLPNLFSKGQLSKMFFLFPELHFKKTKRFDKGFLFTVYTYENIVFNSFYGISQGLVYTNTDMEEVHHWMVKHFSEHPLFTWVPDTELEGKKVQRNGGKNYLVVFHRVAY